MAGLSVARRCADARACLARRASQQRTRPTGPRRNQPSRTHPAAFNCDCSLSFFRIALNSELGRPPPAPASNQAVLGSRTEAAASHIRAERNASAMYKFDQVNQVMLFLHECDARHRLPITQRHLGRACAARPSQRTRSAVLGGFDQLDAELTP